MVMHARYIRRPRRAATHPPCAHRHVVLPPRHLVHTASCRVSRAYRVWRCCCLHCFCCGWARARLAARTLRRRRHSAFSASAPRRTARTCSRTCCWTTCRPRSTRSRSSPTSSPSPAVLLMDLNANLKQTASSLDHQHTDTAII